MFIEQLRFERFEKSDEDVIEKVSSAYHLPLPGGFAGTAPLGGCVSLKILQGLQHQQVRLEAGASG